MSDHPEPPRINKSVLHELIGGLSDGIILAEPSGRIAWANAAAIAMHRTVNIEDLGADAKEYRQPGYCGPTRNEKAG